jgi:hypothetical protein
MPFVSKIGQAPSALPALDMRSFTRLDRITGSLHLRQGRIVVFDLACQLVISAPSVQVASPCWPL